MVLLLLLTQVFAESVSSICSKEYAKREQTSALLYPMISALFSLIYFLIIAKFNLSFNKSTIICGILCGSGVIGSSVSNVMAIRSGPLSITGLIRLFSLSMPTIYGIFFLREPMGRFTVVGLILLIVSLILVNYQKDAAKINKKWVFWVTVSFLLNGFFVTIQKHHQIVNNAQYSNELMVLALSITIAFLLSYILLFRRRNIVKSLKYFYFGAGNGIFNGVGNMSVLLLAPIASASLVYPLTTCCNVVILSLISFLIYKEKLSLRQWVGVAIGAVSAVLLSI